ncbi:MAG: ribosome-binding factor A [Chloroflexi bacterium]|nr:MAG: ribosome-binding factor A [Chloroflexota bacterium]MBA4375733.1 30S ribosome-binding factor RbfA [Anaerolinea sp.]
MPSPMRLSRINDRFQQELAMMFAKNEVRDHRVGGITVTGVSVDREFSYAEIYVSAVEGVSRAKEVLQGLESATGFIRKTLSDRIELRSFPRLRFHWDVTPEKADRIEQLIASIHDEDKKRNK